MHTCEHANMQTIPFNWVEFAWEKAFSFQLYFICASTKRFWFWFDFFTSGNEPSIWKAEQHQLDLSLKKLLAKDLSPMLFVNLLVKETKNCPLQPVNPLCLAVWLHFCRRNILYTLSTSDLERLDKTRHDIQNNHIECDTHKKSRERERKKKFTTTRRIGQIKWFRA